MQYVRILITVLAAIVVFVQAASAGKVVCYYAAWSGYWLNNGSYSIEDIDPTLCTHVVYSFAGLDKDTNEIISLDTWNDLPSGKDGFNRFTRHINSAKMNPISGNRLMKRNSEVIPMIAIGGWSEGSVKYSEMAGSQTSRAKFVNSVLAFLKLYNFGGLDVDWEYPADRGGKPEDKANFVTLLQELKSAFAGRYQLTIAVGVGSWLIDIAYDVPAISRSVDLINLMLYDFKSGYDGKTSHHSSYYDVKAAIELWISKGAPRGKLILGVGAYGRSFTLVDPRQNGPNAPTSGPGIAGPYTGENGYLGYNEICEKNWQKVQDIQYLAPYAYSTSGQWVGYDDPSSIRTKCSLSRSLGLGGGMIWAVNTDDHRNLCRGGKNALTKALKTC